MQGSTTDARTARMQDDRDRRAAELAERRQLRATGAMLSAQRAERETLAQLASTGASERRARAEVLAAEQRDRIKRAHRWQLTSEQLLARCADAVASVRAATEDERADALAWLILSVGKRHGWQPLSEDAQPSYLRRRAHGRILDERERAARREQLSDDDDGQDDDDDTLTAEDRLDALALRAGGSVWAAFTPTTREATAAEVSADALADRLAQLTGEPLSGSERAAVMAALAGYGSGAELAGALGISAGAARKRLHDGRAKLRERFPTADALADALADAQRIGADDDAPTAPRLTAAERAASRAVERVRCAAYRTATLRTGQLPGSGGTGGRVPVSA